MWWLTVIYYLDLINIKEMLFIEAGIWKRFVKDPTHYTQNML